MSLTRGLNRILTRDLTIATPPYIRNQGAAAGGGPTDEHFADVVFLSDCEGADAATSLTEQSSGSRVCTFAGNAAISNTQKKFGDTALYATAGEVSAAYAAAFDVAAQDFTFECHWRPDNTSQTSVLAGHWSVTEATRSWVIAQIGTSFRLILQNEPTTTTNTQTTTPLFSSGVWYHLAVVKSGTIVYLFVDGVAEINGADSGITTIETPTVDFELLDSTAQPSPAAGYMDNPRLTIGVARYTAGFTPPAAAYPTS